MKKYVVGLLLLIAQNVCAMEKEVVNDEEDLSMPLLVRISSQNKVKKYNVKKVDPFAIMRENDEKCRLVAKYLYKYGLGKNDEEVAQTESFFTAKSEPNKSLALCILKYGIMLKNMDREEAWRLMYERHFYKYDNDKLPMYENVPNEIKQTILNEALHFHIANYCAHVSVLEFLKLDRYSKSFLVGTVYYSISCLPHFLLEVTEGNCDTGDHRYKCGNAYIGLTYDDNPNGPFVHYFFGDSSSWQKRRATQELISFFNAKDERINYFKEMLSGVVKPFVTEEPVSFGTFVDLLKTVKDLTEIEDFKIKKENYKRS